MKLTKLVINNFLSIESLELTIDKPGLVLVLGKNLDNPSFNSNGSGKSAVWHALVYCLYNKMLRDTVPIREGQESCSVSIVLDPEDGTEPVFIVRGYNNRKPFFEAYTVDSKEFLFPAKGIKDFDSQLVDWLGLSYQLFVNSVYFGKSLSDLFMLSDDAKRKEILETILNVVSFDKAQDTAKARRKQQETEKARCESELGIWQGRLAEVENNLVKIQEDYDKAKQVYKENYNDCFEKLTVLEARILNHKPSIDKYNNILATKEEEYKQFLAELRASKDNMLLKCSQKSRVLVNKYNAQKAVEAEALKAALKEEDAVYDETLHRQRDRRIALDAQIYESDRKKTLDLAKHAEEMAKIKKLQLTNTKVPCPICYQTIPVDHIASELVKTQESAEMYAYSVQGEQKILDKLAVEKKAICLDISMLTQEKDALTKKHAEDLRKLNDKYSLLIEEANKDIQDYITKINDAYTADYQDAVKTFNNTKTVILSTVVTLKSELDSLEKEKVYLSSKISDLETHYEKLKEKLRFEQGRIPKYKENITTNQESIIRLTAELVMLEFWISAFSAAGIKSFVLENALPYLTDRANHYSGFLTGGVITIEFLPFSMTKTTDKVKEKINIKVTNNFGGSSYQTSSDGEKRRIDLSILLAFQDLLLSQSVRKWNLLIFDEIFDALDDNGIESVVDLLRTMLDKNIYVISHNDTLKKYFDEAIVVHKKNGISYLC